ncbi:MAG TPA: hypothetical protein VG602_05080 [Actinomycetota bacterium]|nr:hypothetical protein [Actinomycetota bacterium]
MSRVWEAAQSASLDGARQAVRGALLAWPGQVETPGMVKRRLMVVAWAMAIAVSGVYAVANLPDAPPWSANELQDMAGLPHPPAQFAPEEDGSLRRLSPEEYQQLQEIRRLIERFPVPDDLVNAGTAGPAPAGGSP